MKRIQRLRTAGWRMPPDCTYVGRPTPWGNPYRVHAVIQGGTRKWEIFANDNPLTQPIRIRFTKRADAIRVAINLYAAYIKIRLSLDPTFLEPLRGRDLACWCGEGYPCHADILIALLTEEGTFV